MSDAITANLESNPVRDDIEEGGEMVGVQFILDVTLDEDERVVKAVAGRDNVVDGIEGARNPARYDTRRGNPVLQSG